MKAALIIIPALSLRAGQAYADGKAVYDASCATCHKDGVAGAPKFGDKAGWATRIKAGNAALASSVLKGKGAIPAKSGNASLSDADVKSAVAYIVKASK